MRHIVPSKGPEVLTLAVHFREDALKASKLSRAGKVNRDVLRRMSQGAPVRFHDVVQACFAAMGCAVTAKGQSMGRRGDREAIERVWAEVMRQFDIDMPSDNDDEPIEHPAFNVDFSDRNEVEQWLTE